MVLVELATEGSEEGLDGARRVGIVVGLDVGHVGIGAYRIAVPVPFGTRHALSLD